MLIEPFNLPHILTIIIMPAIIIVALELAFKMCGENRKRAILLLICCINAILYPVYKVAQAHDPGYDFRILMNLPLHFCNINLILLPLSILLKKKSLMAYQFYFGTVLAALALITVDPAFRSTSLFEFTRLFYFYYHSALAVIPVLLVKHKFYTPSFRVVWQPALMLVCLTFLMHMVNVVFRATGIASESNYFFTYGLRGDPFTELFWSILPYEFFFMLPSLILFAPYIFVTTMPFHLAEKRKRPDPDP